MSISESSNTQSVGDCQFDVVLTQLQLHARNIPGATSLTAEHLRRLAVLYMERHKAAFALFVSNDLSFAEYLRHQPGSRYIRTWGDARTLQAHAAVLQVRMNVNTPGNSRVVRFGPVDRHLAETDIAFNGSDHFTSDGGGASTDSEAAGPALLCNNLY